MLKWGIFSFAHMHAFSYARCLDQIDNCEISGVFDLDETRGRKQAENYKVDYFSDFNKMFDSAPMDVALITNENALHAPIAITAAERKIHVVCEKPIATTIIDAKAMIDASATNGVKLFTCFPCRYSPSAMRIKESMDQGRIGKPLAVAATNHGSFPGGWFADKKLARGGAVMDHTVHVADLLRWFLKDEVREVYAEAGKLLTGADIDDAGLVTMEFSSGAFATLDCSWSRPKTFPTWGDVTMQIIGSEGNLTLDMFRQNIALYSDVNKKAQWVPWGDNIDLLMLKDFARAIEENTDPPVSGTDGLKALEVALAAYEAAETHEPVLLPFEDAAV